MMGSKEGFLWNKRRVQKGTIKVPFNFSATINDKFYQKNEMRQS